MAARPSEPRSTPGDRSGWRSPASSTSERLWMRSFRTLAWSRTAWSAPRTRSTTTGAFPDSPTTSAPLGPSLTMPVSWIRTATDGGSCLWSGTRASRFSSARRSMILFASRPGRYGARRCGRSASTSRPARSRWGKPSNGWRLATLTCSSWSWIGVRPMATTQPLRIEIRYDSAMMSRGSQRIGATVKHPDGRPFAGVTVAFRILEGDGGSFTETGSLNVSGATGTAGTFAASYVAPLVSGPPREIRFQVVVSDETAGTVGRSFTIFVFRETDRFLSLRVSLPAGDIGFLDTPLPVRIEVTDETGTPARDATVTATTVPANGTLTRTNGTAEQMASLLFSPPPDLGATTSYSI